MGKMVCTSGEAKDTNEALLFRDNVQDMQLQTEGDTAWCDEENEAFLFHQWNTISGLAWDSEKGRCGEGIEAMHENEIRQPANLR